MHKTARGWVFREWAPNATDIYLVGDFNDWKETEKYKAKRIEGTGNWELKLSEKAIKHGDLYKMHVHWNGGDGERIPAWTRRVVQDDNTKIFSAQVWNPEPYQWKKKKFKANTTPLLIYECHIGMGQDAEKVGTYTEFKDNVLPRVIEDGYNCIQIMAIQEHPYYGSFGYHVSSFFAASSRFGTPEELKELIDTAHQKIRRLWNTSGDSLFCVVKTLKGPLEDSEIALYTQDWVKTDDVKIDVSSLVAKPDSMNEETFQELSSLMDVKLVGAQLMLDEDALVVNLSVPMLTKEESERLKAVLLQRKLKWNGQNFK